MSHFVAYLRVSTGKQERSGLGLDSQRAAIQEYVSRVGGDIVDTFQDIESGRNSQRLELQKALRRCRTSRATLVVAKLDRLARNVNFISQMMESGVDFVAADMPEANKLTMHIIAAIAEYERQIISERTQRALLQLKAHGKRLGNPGAAAQQSRAVNAAKSKADAFARKMINVLRIHDATGGMSATQLAHVLNAEGVPSRRHRRWTAASIISLRRRTEKFQAA